MQEGGCWWVRNWRFTLLSWLPVLLAGCAPGIAWYDYAYDRVQTAAERDDKLTFVYFRNWYLETCTEFEETILRDPVVLEATSDLYCVPLERDTLVDRPLADKWGIRQTPGYVILNPQGRVLASAYGEISKDKLLISIASAKKAHQREQRQNAPAATVPVTPGG